MKRNYRLKSLLILGLLVPVLTLSGCVLATVRTLDEDEAAKAGFDPVTYVDDIWESRLLPTYEEDAVPLDELLAQLASDREGTIETYGHRSGTGEYSFMARGEGTIVTFDTSSRAGLAQIDLNPPDGTPDISMTIGPLIRISQRASVRDAVGFIEYGDFVNQQEFAGVANAMGDRIIATIAQALGTDDPELIREMDPATIEGKTVLFIGAFTLTDNLEDLVLVPVVLEVMD